MELTPAQATIAIDPHRFRVLCCGRRFGKTTLAIDQIKACAASGPKRIVYIAPTFQQARDIAWAELKRDCQHAAIQINETRLEIRMANVRGSESLIVLRGWEAIETLRGQKFDLVVIDEVASMRNFDSMWEEVVRPTLTDVRGEAIFISTPKGFNHFYTLYNKQETDPDYKSFHFTTYDNPFIPVDEIDKAKKEIPENRFAQEYLADFRKTEGLVYPGFDRERHVFTELPDNIYTASILAGIDWGWTNPASSHKVILDTQGHYWVTDEFYKSGKSTEEIVAHTRTYGAHKVYPDPAEADRCAMARKLGLNVQDVSKDVEAGISCVQDVIAQDRLHVHSSCVNMIWEFETYAYPEKKPDHNESELPIKENDHTMDEIRYILYMNEGKKVVNRMQTFTPNHVGGARRGYYPNSVV